MSHDGAAVGIVMAVAYATTVAAAPPVLLTDESVLAISCGAGLFGGFVLTLIEGVALTASELMKRILASGMVAPAIVALAITYILPAPTLLPVAAVAGIAGIAAYPIAMAIPKIAPRVLRDAMKNWTGGGKP